MGPSDSSCEVSGSLALVLRLSRALGMAPISVTRARAAWRVTPSPPLAVLQALLMTALNIVAVAGLVWDFSAEPDMRVRAGNTTLKAVVWISDLLIMMTVASITIYKGASRMRNFIEVLKKLQQINFDLKINPPSAKTERMRCFVVIMIVVLTTALQLEDINHLAQEAHYDNKLWLVMGPYSVYYYPNVVLVMVALQWYFAARATYAASATINQRLQQLRCANFKSEPKPVLDDLFGAQSVCTLVNSFTTQVKAEPGIPMYKSEAQAQLRLLALSYAGISEVMIQLTAYNGCVMLLTIMSYGMRLVLSPYYLLLEIFDDEVDMFVWSYVVLQLFWILYLMTNLILIIEPCQWTHDQRELTQSLVGQLTVHLAPKCERLAAELDQFAKLVRLDNAHFTPLGIFTLSRPLIVTILGSVTTYLLIIIQFQKISDQIK